MSILYYEGFSFLWEAVHLLCETSFHVCDDHCDPPALQGARVFMACTIMCYHALTLCTFHDAAQVAIFVSAHSQCMQSGLRSPFVVRIKETTLQIKPKWISKSLYLLISPNLRRCSPV